MRIVDFGCKASTASGAGSGNAENLDEIRDRRAIATPDAQIGQSLLLAQHQNFLGVVEDFHIDDSAVRRSDPLHAGIAHQQTLADRQRQDADGGGVGEVSGLGQVRTAGYDEDRSDAAEAHLFRQRPEPGTQQRHASSHSTQNDFDTRATHWPYRQCDYR